jgi:hypothetical protein
MKTPHFVLAILALSGSALVSSAHANASAFGAPDSATGKSSLAASKARKNGFTPLVAKKGGSGVAMAYRIEGTPAMGSPLTIRVTMAASSDAQVTLRAGEGLVLNRPDQVLVSAAGQSAEHTITVVPQAEGRFYLNLFSVAAGRGSAMSIPVQVGKGAVQLKPSGNVQVMPNGERVISVPAQ